MCISKNVDNVDNFVEKYYLQPEMGLEKPGKPVKQAETADLHKKSRDSYVNRLSTKKSTCISVEKHQKACG